MKGLAVCVFFSALLSAQTAETQIFRAVLLPASEVPPVNNSARAVADVIVNAVRDPTGTVVSGTIDVYLRTTLAAGVTATGLNLHNAPTGQTAPAMFTADLSTGNSRALQTGADAIHMPINVAGDNSNTLGGLRSLLQDPTRFYVNVPSTDQPNGLMRGQLQRTVTAVLLAQLNSDNVLPAPQSTGNGVAQVVAIGTRDAGGNWTSGEVYLWSTYAGGDQSIFNGFHIHQGVAGATGAIGLSATLLPGSVADYNGFATLGPYYAEIATNNAVQTATFTNLFFNPAALYIDIHTGLNPNGILRAQLRGTDSMTFALLLDSASELQPTSIRTRAPANFTFYTLRNEDGSIAAATMLTDVNYRLAGPTQFIGIYIHDGDDKANGPMSIKAAPDFAAENGSGNYFGWTLPIANLTALADLIGNPANHYADLHTVADPAGLARAQFGIYVSARAGIAAALGANLDKTATLIAPGGLISIFGTNLTRVATDLSGWKGQQLPVALNGSRVSIAGKAAPLIYVSPGQINAQVPLDVPIGVQTLTVDNGNGASAAYSVNVAAVAPAIFFYPVPTVVKNASFSVVSAANPARAGDVLLVFATGMGQTTPAIATGRLIPNDVVARTATVTGTIGGRPATVVYSIASPGFTGLYQVAMTVPTGVTGSVPLMLQMGTVESNAVNINIQ